jgi:phosphoesterase RecJ-like protein
MELTAKQQAISAIEKANHILLISSANPDGDSVGSALAMYHALAKIGKKATLACADPIPSSLQFLPGSDKFVSNISKNREFVIKLNIKNIKAKEVRYETEGDELKLIVVPENGNFQASDLSVGSGKSPYDLLIVFDAADVDMLGKIYDDNTELFFETPLIVIDHHASNEFYGEVNLVEVTATSTCEVLVSLLESLDAKIIDEDIATCLMTGLVSDTGSFQNSNTTPKSLTVAAQLSALGACHQEIVKNLFKTKSYTQLRLWGRVLSRLKHDAEHRLVWSLAKLTDYQETGALPAETGGLIDELMTSAPEADYVILISEREPGEIYGSIRSAKGIDSVPLAQALGGGGHPGAAGFKLSGLTLESAEEHVLAVAREIQRQRLGLKSVSTAVTGQAVESELRQSQDRQNTEKIEEKPQPVQSGPLTPVSEVIGEKRKACGLWGETLEMQSRKQKAEDNTEIEKQEIENSTEKRETTLEGEQNKKPVAEKSVADLLREVAEEISQENE